MEGSSSEPTCQDAAQLSNLTRELRDIFTTATSSQNLNQVRGITGGFDPTPAAGFEIEVLS
jgi:hypothetical protein